MIFKKFAQFLEEKTQEKLLQENPEAVLICSKCGQSRLECDCYTDDYFNAKNSQWLPKSKKRKSKNEFKTDN